MTGIIRQSKLPVFFVLAILLTGCSKPELLIEEYRYFEQHVKNNPSVDKLRHEANGSGLFFASRGSIEKPVAFFIHGTPGGWHDGARYLMHEGLREHVRIVVIDRPGWGESPLPDDNTVPSFNKQVKMIASLLARLKAENGGRPVIVVGHSLGASLAPLLAMDYPDLVDGLVLVSGSHDPELGSPRWYNLAASMGMVTWFLDPELKRANWEIMPLGKELKKIVPRWSSVRVPVTLIQGMEDKLVSPENADFVEGLIPGKQLDVIRIKNGGHFIPWEHTDVVTDAITDLLVNQ